MKYCQLEQLLGFKTYKLPTQTRIYRIGQHFIEQIHHIL